MADVCLSSGENCGEEIMDLNKDLERMLEDMDNISVQGTWMTYDMMVQRSNPDLADSLRRLEEEYQRCKAVICGSPGDQQDQNQGQEPDMGQRPGLERQECPAGPMERMDLKSAEQGDANTPIDLEHTMRGLDSMSECLDKLALRTQLKLCDLIVCFGHPDKMAALSRTEEPGPKAGPNPEE